MFLMSGETVTIEMVFSRTSGPFTLYAESGHVAGIDERHWSWTAPRRPGLYRLVLTDADMSDPVVIEAQVLEPVGRDRAPERVEDFMG